MITRLPFGAVAPSPYFGCQSQNTQVQTNWVDTPMDRVELSKVGVRAEHSNADVKGLRFGQGNNDAVDPDDEAPLTDEAKEDLKERLSSLADLVDSVGTSFGSPSGLAALLGQPQDPDPDYIQLLAEQLGQQKEGDEPGDET